MDIQNFLLKNSFTFGLSLALFTTPALGANFDFQNLADTNANAGGTGESAWNPFQWTDAGITVTATARNLANTQDYFVYMDRGNAGMGVCKTLKANAQTGVQNGGTNLCSQASDDNITYDEVLKLEFSEKVSIDLLELVNGSHGTNFDGSNFGILVDGATPTMVSDFDTTNALIHNFNKPELLTGTTFHFISGATVAGIDNFNNLDQMYISAISANAVATPEPATLALFGSGLLGLVGIRKLSSRRSEEESGKE